MTHGPLSNTIPVGIPGFNESDGRIFLIQCEGCWSMRRTRPYFRFTMKFSNVEGLNIEDKPESLG
jgi:hypothetical protein